MKKIIAIIILVVVIVAGGWLANFFWGNNKNAREINKENILPQNSAQNLAPEQGSGNNAVFSEPVSRSAERVLKKPFGIEIVPETSPIQPERFSGFHTGVDFETFDDEQNSDVEISAICDGVLLIKEYVSGYGGVAAQSCKLDKQDIIILYGHLRLSSIVAAEGAQFKAGEKIGLLGKGFSAETDNERKHLHLAIHKGKEVNFKGYVANKKNLFDWIDPCLHLPCE